MMPGQNVAPPHPSQGLGQPHAPSPLVALLMHHAQGAAPQPHTGGMVPQAAGAPMPLNAGGHASARFGHAPSVMPGGPGC